MLPTFKLGLFGTEASLYPIVQQVFSQIREVAILETANAVEGYLEDAEFSGWKILIARQRLLADSEPLLTSLREAYLKDKKSHFIILCSSDDPLNLFNIFSKSENVHIVESPGPEEAHEFGRRLQVIKAALDLQWLYSKASDASRLCEEVYSQGLDQKTSVQSFLEKLLSLIEAQSINVYHLEDNAQSFIKEAGVGTPAFTSVTRADIETAFDFNESCNTYVIHPNYWAEKLAPAAHAEQSSQTCLLSTYVADADPTFIVYTFDDLHEGNLLCNLCNIASRELLRLYRSSELRSQHSLLKSLSELDNVSEEKQHVLFKILSYLRSYFGAEAAAIIELSDNDSLFEFEKIYLERARKGRDTFRGTKGFAHFCVTNVKALLINEIDADNPCATALAFDPEQLFAGRAEKVEVETLRAPHAVEMEKSLMYFPFKYGQRNGAIKVSDFTRSDGFNLRQLRALKVFSPPIAAILRNIYLVARLRAEVERMGAQTATLDVADVLFFYREITLGIFHQVGNHLTTADSEILMLSMFMDSRGDKATELADHLHEAKLQIKLANELIGKAQRRGLSLNPIEQTCELIGDVIRPSLDYAKNRVKGTGIVISHSLSNEMYEVKLDIELARECMLNLLNNAIWAVKSNSKTKKALFIVVRRTPDGHHVRIDIEDSGIGIAPENFKKMFTAGFTTRQGGTGLGLFFTRKLIEHFGGTVNIVRSQLGKGTTVELILPLMGAGQ